MHQSLNKKPQVFTSSAQHESDSTQLVSKSQRQQSSTECTSEPSDHSTSTRRRTGKQDPALTLLDHLRQKQRINRLLRTARHRVEQEGMSPVSAQAIIREISVGKEPVQLETQKQTVADARPSPLKLMRRGCRCREPLPALLAGYACASNRKYTWNLICA
eukprot:6173869-Pleurochrysis_carterae.AAC.2